MAIHNGNKDFYLSVLQSATKQLKISFKTPANTNKVSLIVQRPGDSGIVLKKDFFTTPGTNHTQYVEVPYYGEYYVKVSAVLGTGYDYFVRGVKLQGTHTQTKTFTQADVDKWKIDTAIALATFTAVGLYAQATLAAAVTILAAGQAATAIGNHDTEAEAFTPPRVGWGMRTTMYDNGSSIQVKWEMIDTYKNVQQTKYGQVNYVKW